MLFQIRRFKQIYTIFVYFPPILFTLNALHPFKTNDVLPPVLCWGRESGPQGAGMPLIREVLYFLFVSHAFLHRVSWEDFVVHQSRAHKGGGVHYFAGSTLFEEGTLLGRGVTGTKHTADTVAYCRLGFQFWFLNLQILANFIQF